MKKINCSFLTQVLVGFAIMGLCFFASELLETGIFQNVAWICWGLMWIIHPVWPKMWDYSDHDKLRKGCRIAGALAVAMGLFTQFGGY